MASKRLSLYGADLKDALRVALITPTKGGTKRPKPKQKAKAKTMNRAESQPTRHVPDCHRWATIGNFSLPISI